MRTLLLVAVTAALLLPCDVLGQEATAPGQAQRKERIRANLLYLFPQLAQYDVQMGDLGASGVDGLEEGTFVINGQQVQRFLVTPDDEQLFILTAGPFDVSKTPEELAAAEAERQAEELAQARTRSAELEAEIAGLPLRGNPGAPVTMVAFSDFQCPYCARVTPTIEELLQKRPDDVKLAFLHFPLPNHPWARPAAIAAACAAEQDPDAFWTLHDQYFANQDDITLENVAERSRAFLAGTDVELDAWAVCATDTTSAAYQAAATEVDENIALGRQMDLTGTPSFFINGRYVNGAQPLETFEALVDEALQNQQADR